MEFERGETGVYKRDYWRVLSASMFTDVDYEYLEENGSFGPYASLQMTLDVDEAQLANVVARKWEYMEAAEGDDVPFDEVMDAVAQDLARAYDIIFNKVGYDSPDEGLYEKINQDQWKQTTVEAEYSTYRDLLWEIADGEAGVPSIPGLYHPFVAAAAESPDHTIPPEGIVEDIISEHIDNVRAEKNARAGVRKAKREMEKRGVQPRHAASVANSLEPLLKTDAEIERESE